MQYKLKFIKLLILLSCLILLYFTFPEFFRIIDKHLFLFLNKTCLNNKLGQYVFGFLSHKNESWINVIIMLGVNILSIFIFSRINKQHLNKSIAIILYCWLSFQMVLLFNYIVFQKFLQINRDSPSVIFNEAIRLSVTFNNLNIKDYSNNSFPAGHALFLIYWILFVNLQGLRSIKIISWILGILFVLPRMVTGAHWVSDTVFSLLLGWIYFNISMWFANSYEQIKQRIY